MKAWVGIMALIGIGGFAIGASTFSKSLSAVHEIEALISLLIGAVGLGSAGIIDTLIRTAERKPPAP